MATKCNMEYWIGSCNRKITLVETLIKFNRVCSVVNSIMSTNFVVLRNIPWATYRARSTVRQVKY